MDNRARIWAAGCGFLALAALGTGAAAFMPVGTTPGALANFITAGTPDPNGKVPSLNAVPGAGVNTLSVAIPVAVLHHGSVYTYLVSSQNTTYTGTCKDSFTLTQGTGASKVTLDSGVIKASYSCGAGTTWVWAINGKVIPNSPGLATLTGIVTYGTSKVFTKTTVLIQ
jgi:hypothetical protein